MPRFQLTRSRRWLLAGLLMCAATPLLLFPGRRLPIAWTLATGLGVNSLQARIDALEAKAIARAAFTDDERAFLVDFYGTLATGAKCSIAVRQTGALMDHYLDESGSDYELAHDIFTTNDKVIKQGRALLQRAGPCEGSQRMSSGSFYMPDQSNTDSVFGLYHGSLTLLDQQGPDGTCQRRFRAEVPWTWPSYAELRRKYGDPHAESFPLPNARSVLMGPQHALRVDNGLGQYLEELGIAKRFLAFAVWSEAEWELGAH